MDLVPGLLLFVGVFVLSILASVNGVIAICILSIYLTMKNFFPLSNYDWSVYAIFSLILTFFLMFRLKTILINFLPILFLSMVVAIGFFVGRVFQSSFEVSLVKVGMGLILILVSEYLRRNLFLLNLDTDFPVDSRLILSFFDLFMCFILSALAGVFGINLYLVFYIFLILKVQLGFYLADVIVLLILLIVSIVFSLHKMIAYESVYSEYLSPYLLIAIALGVFAGYRAYRVFPAKMKARFVLYGTCLLSIKNLVWGFYEIFR